MLTATTLALSLALTVTPVAPEQSADDPSGAQEEIELDYDTPPRPIKLSKPRYPRAAFESGLEGTVVVEITIDSRGRVAKARVKESATGLDEAALKCVAKWRFRPAIKAGKPVATLANAPVMFRIK
jgi:periplasmic protein TonB